MGSSSVLGPDHPLARADARMRTLRAQLAVTATFGLVSALASLLLGSAALHLALGAAAVSAVLGAAALVARGNLRERALQLIASGREELPVEAVKSERDRLSDRRYRRRLARTIDTISAESRSPEWWTPITPITGDRDAVRGARAELAEIARLLRDLPNVRACGVALATCLVRDGATSPLYQGPAPRLREELGRIRHTLVTS